MMNTEPNTCPECGLDLVDDGCEKHCASCGLVFDAPSPAPAPNQMLDETYNPGDEMLEMEYEDRNGCGYSDDETVDPEPDTEPDVDDSMDGDHESALESVYGETDPPEPIDSFEDY